VRGSQWESMGDPVLGIHPRFHPLWITSLLYVQVYECIYVMHTHMHAHTHTQAHIFIYMYTNIHIYKEIGIYMYIYIYMYLSTHTYQYPRAWHKERITVHDINPHTHTHTHVRFKHVDLPSLEKIRGFLDALPRIPGSSTCAPGILGSSQDPRILGSSTCAPGTLPEYLQDRVRMWVTWHACGWRGMHVLQVDMHVGDVACMSCKTWHAVLHARQACRYSVLHARQNTCKTCMPRHPHAQVISHIGMSESLYLNTCTTSICHKQGFRQSDWLIPMCDMTIACRDSCMSEHQLSQAGVTTCNCHDMQLSQARVTWHICRVTDSYLCVIWQVSQLHVACRDNCRDSDNCMSHVVVAIWLIGMSQSLCIRVMWYGNCHDTRHAIVTSIHESHDTCKFDAYVSLQSNSAWIFRGICMSHVGNGMAHVCTSHMAHAQVCTTHCLKTYKTSHVNRMDEEWVMSYSSLLQSVSYIPEDTYTPVYTYIPAYLCVYWHAWICRYVGIIWYNITCDVWHAYLRCRSWYVGADVGA